RADRSSRWRRDFSNRAAAQRDDGDEAPLLRIKLLHNRRSLCSSELVQTGSDDRVGDREAEVVAKKALAVRPAELIVVRAKATFKEASEGAQQRALQSVLIRILEVGGGQNEPAVRYAAHDGGQRFTLKPRLRDQRSD